MKAQLLTAIREYNVALVKSICKTICTKEQFYIFAADNDEVVRTAYGYQREYNDNNQNPAKEILETILRAIPKQQLHEVMFRFETALICRRDDAQIFAQLVQKIYPDLKSLEERFKDAILEEDLGKMDAVLSLFGDEKQKARRVLFERQTDPIATAMQNQKFNALNKLIDVVIEYDGNANTLKLSLSDREAVLALVGAERVDILGKTIELFQKGEREAIVDAIFADAMTVSSTNSVSSYVIMLPLSHMNDQTERANAISNNSSYVSSARLRAKLAGYIKDGLCEEVEMMHSLMTQGEALLTWEMASTIPDLLITLFDVLEGRDHEVRGPHTAAVVQNRRNNVCKQITGQCAVM